MRPWPRLFSACCRCRRPGEKSRTGGSPSLPSWVGSALPRGPICRPGCRSGDFDGPEVAADLRDHGLLGEEPEPKAEAMLGLRVARSDLLRHAYWNLPSHQLDGPPLPITPAGLGRDPERRTGQRGASWIRRPKRENLENREAGKPGIRRLPFLLSCFPDFRLFHKADGSRLYRRAGSRTRRSVPSVKVAPQAGSDSAKQQG